VCRAFTWEILVVDDGSKDDTAGLVQRKYVNAHADGCVRLLRLARNNGKGGAVRKGMVRGRGQYLIMADADGATQASDLTRLLAELRGIEAGGLGIAIGSRAHLSDPAAGVSRTPLRRFLMWGFHTFITLMIGGGGTAIKDTQCGFKMFSRAAAAALFPVQHIDRWAFDVELLFLAARKGIPMVVRRREAEGRLSPCPHTASVPVLLRQEVPVTWQEIDGSTMDLMSDAPKMARDIAAIRLAYAAGVWSDSADPAADAAERVHGEEEEEGMGEGGGGEAERGRCHRAAVWCAPCSAGLGGTDCEAPLIGDPCVVPADVGADASAAAASARPPAAASAELASTEGGGVGPAASSTSPASSSSSGGTRRRPGRV
jgi:dolichyl-phosphate beta-glucosyltransferase